MSVCVSVLQHKSTNLLRLCCQVSISSQLSGCAAQMTFSMFDAIVNDQRANCSHCPMTLHIQLCGYTSHT